MELHLEDLDFQAYIVLKESHSRGELRLENLYKRTMFSEEGLPGDALLSIDSSCQGGVGKWWIRPGLWYQACSALFLTDASFYYY